LTQSTQPLVWVVDDSRLQAHLCRDALTPAYTVEVFESGAAMLETLTLGQLPQLLVLDWHMPDMSGVEVCRFVRETLDTGRLPILILTGATSEESLLEALSAGANDFVRKPFLVSELNARVAALVRSAAMYSKLLQTENQLRVEADFRERFMGLLAHDLRQPLNTIFMANSTLASSLDSPRLTKTMQMQMRAAKRMKGMIAELLDFTRVRPETGMPIHRVATDLEATTRSVLEEVQAIHPERPFEFQALGNCTGDWDPDRLAQVCSNLLGNAIEHGHASAPIVVRVDGSDENLVTLVVRNVGRPIAAELLQHLFLPFRRAGGGPRGGVGLGLYIVEQIVAAHGGGITAHSDTESTRFVVHLPR
jgi:signal transduction histidine kinase